MFSEAGNRAQMILQMLLNCRSHRPPLLVMADESCGPTVSGCQWRSVTVVDDQQHMGLINVGSGIVPKRLVVNF